MLYSFKNIIFWVTRSARPLSGASALAGSPGLSLRPQVLGSGPLEALASLSRTSWDVTMSRLRWAPLWFRIELPLLLFRSQGGVSILVVSAYLRDSEGLSESNLGILCKLGAALSSFLGPFMLGADFQMEPDVLASCDLVSVLSANLVSPESKGTCTGTSKE